VNNVIGILMEINVKMALSNIAIFAVLILLIMNINAFSLFLYILFVLGARSYYE
jgi:hypothetical protein